MIGEKPFRNYPFLLPIPAGCAIIKQKPEGSEGCMECPVCGKENNSALCPECGFDTSRDYEKHPTLSPVRTGSIF